MTRNRRFRLLDLFVLAASAPIWVPVMAICAAAVAIGSGRPVFFRQERVGRDGAAFQVLKFRSMRMSDRPEAPSAATITGVGAVLRRTSLDELPQLLNVLRGEMSLVGPRPMLPRQVAALSCGQERRHLVRPGHTGLAQVSGRNSIPWAQRLALDVQWATSATPRDYFRIIATTFGGLQRKTRKTRIPNRRQAWLAIGMVLTLVNQQAQRLLGLHSGRVVLFVTEYREHFQSVDHASLGLTKPKRNCPQECRATHKLSLASSIICRSHLRPNTPQPPVECVYSPSMDEECADRGGDCPD